MMTDEDFKGEKAQAFRMFCITQAAWAALAMLMTETQETEEKEGGLTQHLFRDASINNVGVSVGLALGCCGFNDIDAVLDAIKDSAKKAATAMTDEQRIGTLQQANQVTANWIRRYEAVNSRIKPANGGLIIPK